MEARLLKGVIGGNVRLKREGPGAGVVTAFGKTVCSPVD